MFSPKLDYKDNIFFSWKIDNPELIYLSIIKYLLIHKYSSSFQPLRPCLTSRFTILRIFDKNIRKIKIMLLLQPCDKQRLMIELRSLCSLKELLA